MSDPEYPALSGSLEMMSVATFDRIADQIEAGHRLKTLRFYMLGEPFLNKNTVDFIRTAKQRNLADRIEVTTNGSPLVNADLRRAILESGLDYLRISVYATDKDKQLSLTQSKVPPDAILGAVAALTAERDRLGAQTYIYAKFIDGGNRSETERFLSAYGEVCDEAQIENPMNWDGQNDYLSPLRADSGHEGEGQTSDGYRPARVACPYPFYTAVIHVNGDVSLCCVDWSKATKVGNIHEDALGAIWRGPAAQAFRRLHLAGKRAENKACAQCQYLLTAPDDIDRLVDPAK